MSRQACETAPGDFHRKIPCKSEIHICTDISIFGKWSYGVKANSGSAQFPLTMCTGEVSKRKGSSPPLCAAGGFSDLHVLPSRARALSGRGQHPLLLPHRATAISDTALCSLPLCTLAPTEPACGSDGQTLPGQNPTGTRETNSQAQASRPHSPDAERWEHRSTGGTRIHFRANPVPQTAVVGPAPLPALPAVLGRWGEVGS